MKIKLIIIILTIGVMFIIPSDSYAQMGMPTLSEIEEKGSDLATTSSELNSERHSENINEVLAELLNKYQVSRIDKLECEQLSDGDFEKLGEAWMGVMHPDPKAHEQMDNMMGGEGSVSLRQAHINMGQRYLGCGRGFGMMGGTGIMGMGNMMTGLGWGGLNMMNYSGPGGFGGLFWIINSILLTVLLLVIIRYFWHKGGNKK